MTQACPPPSGISADVSQVNRKWPAFVSAFLVVFGNTLIMIGLLFYLKDVLKATEGMVGLCTSVGMGAYAIGTLLLKNLLHKTNPRALVISSLICITASASLITLVHASWYVLVIQIIAGAALTLHWSPLMGWLCRGIEGKELNRTISMFNLSWSLGGIIGPMCAGVLSEINVYYPLILGPVFTFAALMTTVTSVKMDSLPEGCDDRSNNPADAVKETGLRYPAWVGLFFAFIALGVLVVVFPLFSRAVYGVSKQGVGFFLFQRSLVMTLTFLVLGGTVFWHYNGFQMVFGHLLLAGSIVLLSFTKDYLLILVWMSFAGVAVGMSYSNSLFHGVAGSANRVERAAVHEIILAFGFIIGSTGGGYLYQMTSMSLVFGVSLALLLVSAVVQVVMIMVMRK